MINRSKNKEKFLIFKKKIGLENLSTKESKRENIKPWEMEEEPINLKFRKTILKPSGEDK